MPSNSTQVFTNVICPLIGMCIANFMWLTPLPIVLEARYTRKMGAMNPYPFVVTILNCVAWVIYGSLTKDFFLFFSNIFGIALGMFYSITSLTIMAKQSPEAQFSELYVNIEFMFIFAIVFWGVMGMVAGTAFENASDPKMEGAHMIGNIGCAFAISYYAAPLATMAQVLAKKDASSLYLPMILVNLVNGTMWTLYGFIGKNDINIYGPNLIGTILTIIQVVLCLIFPAKERKQGQSFSDIYLLLQGKIPPSSRSNAQDVFQGGSSIPLAAKVDDFED